MNFKTKYFFVLLIISIFLLSGCEVYQTLYGTAPQETKEQATPEQKEEVFRVEGEQGKNPVNLAKAAYAAAVPTEHDPFKLGKNPLGPFPEGKSLGFTLGQWLSATGTGVYSVEGINAKLSISFKNLVPNGVYTLWCSSITFPPDPKIVDKPCGAADGSENSFVADADGNAVFSLKLKPLEQSTKETASVVALAYHSDGKTYGAGTGDFGLATHVQIFFLMPVPAGKTPSSYTVDMQFVNHIQAGFPEQDVFIEPTEMEKVEEEEMAKEAPEEEKPEEVMEKPEVTGEIVKEEAKPEEKETVVEEKTEKEEIVEEKPKEKPIVIVVQETDLVSLVPKAEDPDKDTALVFTFTSPLSENGEWQTTYGDSGEYTITVTASDGESTTSRDVLIIVNKKEETPTIDSSKPIESGLVIDETQSIDFSIEASDLNNDVLSYVWKIDGFSVGSESKYTYQTTYDDSGTHTVKVDVSDSLSSASKIWSVDVKNVNRKPVLEKIDDITVKETDKLTIVASAADDDKDTITYSISDKRFTQDGNVFTWQTDYNSAGTYEVTITASDGQDTTEQQVAISVENVNRPPQIIDIITKK